MAHDVLKKVGDVLVPTRLGQAVLTEVVTDPTGPVYLIKDLPPETVGAMMARLSRSANGCRVLYLDEFYQQVGQDEKLLDRVITGFGDDSVQQLMTVYLVCENISNLMTKLLERPRPGSYLEQSTRYIYFDQKDENGQYRYYTPLDIGDFKSEYERVMDRIFDLYSRVVRTISDHLIRTKEKPEDTSEAGWQTTIRGQACDAARAMLPAATTSTVGAVLSTQSVDSLVMYLRSLDLPEAVSLADSILRESRKRVGGFLKRTDLENRGMATTAYMAETRARVQAFIDENELTGMVKESDFSVSLVDYDKDVDSMLAQALFAGSDKSLSQLLDWVKGQRQAEKAELLQSYIGERLNRRHKPGRAFERQRYWWEIVGRYGDFRDIQRHRMVDGMEWQRLTPYLGHDVEPLVCEAGVANEHEEAFRLSHELYEKMAERFGREAAQYATLFGHKMRYTFGTNLREAYHLIELRSGPDGHAGYRKIAQEMFARIEEVTPELAKGMKFVNMREPGPDDEMTRLASVRAQEFKHRQALLLTDDN